MFLDATLGVPQQIHACVETVEDFPELPLKSHASEASGTPQDGPSDIVGTPLDLPFEGPEGNLFLQWKIVLKINCISIIF